MKDESGTDFELWLEFEHVQDVIDDFCNIRVGRSETSRARPDEIDGSDVARMLHAPAREAFQTSPEKQETPAAAGVSQWSEPASIR